MDIKEEINYWIATAQDDLHCFPSDEAVEEVRTLFNFFADSNQLLYYIPDGKKGIIAYSIIPDFRGGRTVSELFMYIKPEFRGSIKLFKELVNAMEQCAIDNNCSSVRIASNIGYDDDKVLRVLQLFGYKTDMVVKYMR